MSAAVALEPDDSQERAIDLICNARFGIVTGGPGTGKTTSLRRALEQIEAPYAAANDNARPRIELCAPTGKAAKRMSEATGREARTIHRLLNFHPVQGFLRNHTTPLDCELVIVDEASMLDVELAACLFDAIGPSTRCILVGDANQLPSVGPGRVFADLVGMHEVPSARLTHVHRSAAESWVNRNAPLVLAGRTPELARTHDFEFVEVSAAGDVLEAVRRIVESDNEAQVLIPQRPGSAGVERANEVLQRVINPLDESDGPLDKAAMLQRDRYALRAGDRVIQTANNYTLNVFNGDVGTILSVHKGEVLVAIDERGSTRDVTYSLDQARALELAYALTIHKSQGSEFNHVVVVVHSTHTFVLNRALLYTAITRTRKRVTIVGDHQGIKSAINSQHKEVRNTTLVERIRGELDEVIVPDEASS